jgi:hypothetical protein
MPLFIGVDPGPASGCIAVLDVRPHLHRPLVALHPLGVLPEPALWRLISSLAGATALIERQVPRPTMLGPSVSRVILSTALPSTALLYGSYMQLRAMLRAARISYEEADPKAWQKECGTKKRRGEAKRLWKRRLWEAARALYPGLRLTIPCADSLLLAHLCWRRHTGASTNRTLPRPH